MRGPWQIAAVGIMVLASGCSATDKHASLVQPELPRGLDLDDAIGATHVGEVVDSSGGDASEVLGKKGTGEACAEGAECTSGFCLDTRQGRMCASRCDAIACPLGRECRTLSDASGARAAVCVDRFASLCLPCRTHEDCALDGDASARCRAAGDAFAGRFCASACGEGLPPCPTGFACDGAQCLPVSGAACTCSPLAVARGASTDCGRAGDGGVVCDGTRTCLTAEAAPSACDAPTPQPEVCNGRDDDCDGATDEAPLAPDCGAYACAGAAGCRASCDSAADCAPGLGCVEHACVATGADGSPCAGPDDCDHGYCANGHCCAPDASGTARLCCAQDSDCVALDGHAACDNTSSCQGSSVVGRCQDSVCAPVKVADPGACAGSSCAAASCVGSGVDSVWHGVSLCSPDGACVAGGEVACDDQDACTNDICTAAQGCNHAPTIGATNIACYGFDAATRGVGICHDGKLACLGAQGSDCKGDQGPVDEVCDGLDNDCDGATDETGASECFPYLCGGKSGCGWSCQGDKDCADGAFCNDFGDCVALGDDGALCQSDAGCKSGHCDNGACCAGGICCQGDADCWMYDASACDDAASCAGHVDIGVCGADFVCASRSEAAPDACQGEPCGGGQKCDGSTLVSAETCGPDGLCGVVAETTSCAPFGCRDGACLTSCVSAADCAAGSTCGGNGLCLLPNGSACNESGECASGRCNNGYCCTSGTCCAADADCASFGDAGSCTNPGNCEGTQLVGTCDAGSASCRTATIKTPAPCVNVACKTPECQNLSGGSFIKEGVLRGTCDATGNCNEATRDCRDLDNTAFCGNSSSYPLCANCSPGRATCIVLGLQCRCE